MLWHPTPRVEIRLPRGGPDDRKAAVSILNQLTRLVPFAHHPSCRYYHNHLIHIAGHPFCLGCFSVSLGICVGLLLLSSPVEVLPEELFAIGLAAYVPTLAQIWYQRYVFKIVSRLCLGTGLVLMFSAAFFGYSWFSALSAGFNLLLIGCIAGLFVFTKRLRARHMEDPCQRCPEGRFPFCRWRLPVIRSLLRQQAEDPATMPDYLADFLRAVEGQLLDEQCHVHPTRVEFLDLTSD